MIQVKLGTVDNDKLGSSLRTASIINNYNDYIIQGKTTLETSNRILGVAECAKTNARNVMTGNMLYSDYITNANASATVAFVSTSANFHLTSETDITLTNPTGLVAGKCQKGIIVAEAPIVTVGTFWKHAGGTTNIGVPDGFTYDTYSYMYTQINETIILLSFIGGINGGI